MTRLFSILLNRIQSDMPMTWHKITTCLPGQTPRIEYTKAEIHYHNGMVKFFDSDGFQHHWPINYTWVDREKKPKK